MVIGKELLLSLLKTKTLFGLFSAVVVSLGLCEVDNDVVAGAVDIVDDTVDEIGLSHSKWSQGQPLLHPS